MRDINELYELLKAWANSSDKYVILYPDDHNAFRENMDIHKMIWLIESDSYFNDMKEIFLDK